MKLNPFSAISSAFNFFMGSEGSGIYDARVEESLRVAGSAFCQNECQPNQEDRQDFVDAVLWNIMERGALASSLVEGYASMLNIMFKELVEKDYLKPEDADAFKAYGDECFALHGESWKKIKYDRELPHFLSFTKVLNDGSPDTNSYPLGTYDM